MSAPSVAERLGAPDPLKQRHFTSASDLAAPPERRMADAVRALVLEAAGSPAMADAATALCARVMRFDATDPRWPDRDRLVVSAAHNAVLLHVLLHLTGHAGVARDDLARFRDRHGRATAIPELGAHPAVEATTGPPGQGLANAVGMAMAERMLAARFGRSLVDHRTWVLASAADLAHGLGHEALELAGQLRLARLTVLLEEDPDPATDVLKRVAPQGWATRRVDAHDPAQLAAALSLALRAKKPTLIACRTAQPAAPAPATPITPDLADRWRVAGLRGGGARRAWLKRLARHPMRAEFDRVLAGRLPETWHEALGLLRAQWSGTPPQAPGAEAARHALAPLAACMPELVGAAPEPGAAPGLPSARLVAVGAREHGMAAALNGLALHGGLVAIACTSLAASDAFRPALRLAALMRLRQIYLLASDDAAEPHEQLASLRALPGLHVFRPADPIEIVECWDLALRRSAGPTVLVLSQRDLPALRQDAAENRCARGGYVLVEADGARQVTLIATGAELACAVAARDMLAAAGTAAAIVSLPCWELFAQQDEAYRLDVLGTAPRIGIEAACGFGWERWLGDSGLFVGPKADDHAHLSNWPVGITPHAITAAVQRRLLPN